MSLRARPAHVRCAALVLPVALGVGGLVGGVPAARASDPQAALVPPATSWIANSGAGGPYGNPASKWVQQAVQGAAVDTDGTMYAATVWDEGGSNVGVYRGGQVVGHLMDTGGWGRVGGSAVAVDRSYVYQAMEQDPQSGIDSPTSGSWFGFRRFDKTSLQQAGLPANGHSSLGSMRVVSTSAPVTGLAASATEVYAAVSGEGRVHVFRTSDYAEVRSFAAPAVTQLAIDRTGAVWAVRGLEVDQYSSTGTLLTRITDVVKPTSVAFDPSGRLLIGSDGPRQQVLVYDVSSTPREVDAVGVPGGMFAAPAGAAGPLRFNGPVGVGADAAGNIYVANGLGGDGTDLVAVAPTSSGWQQRWQLLGLAFVDNADLSPTDDTVAFTSRDRFTLDLSQPPGKQWTWTAHTIDRFAYPNDPRADQDTHQYVTPDAVVLGGAPFLFQTGMYQDSPRFFRFNGNIAVPSTVFPSFHGWGWQVDASGDVWNSDGNVLYHYAFLGLGAAGDPRYAPVQTVLAPAGMPSVQRVRYDVATDTMFLSGWTPQHPLPSGNDTEKMIGGEVWRIPAWSTGNRTPTWRTPVPFTRVGSDIRTLYGQIGLSFAGDRFFTVESGTSRIRSYDSTTGAQLSDWLPGAEVGGYVGVVDIPDGIRAVQRSDGSYVVFVEEDAEAKVLMYVLPLGSGSPTGTTGGHIRYLRAVRADAPLAQYGFDGPSGAASTSGAMPGSTGWLVSAPNQVLQNSTPPRTGASWSLEAWVKVDPSSGSTAPFWSTPGAGWSGLLRTYIVGKAGQQTALLSAYGAPTVPGGAAQEQVATGVTGSWQYVVLSVTAATSSLYVNGVLVGVTAGVSTGLPGWTVGSPSGSAFRGALDEVAVYGKALTVAQVRRHYVAATGS